MKIKVFEAFAGYGSQSLSLRDVEVDHEVVGVSEIEPDAIIAYGSLRYDINNIEVDLSIDEMRAEFMAKNVGWDFKKQKSRIPRMKKDKLIQLYKYDKVCKNYGDISIINPNDLPNFDYFTYSFPCTDLSVAGKQEGLKGGTRSGLLYECEKIIEVHKPKYLLMENVKNLVSKKFKPDFDKWCEYLEDLGYKNYWKILNAKDFGIPQNRERVFMVSILDDAELIMPNGIKLETKLKDILENQVDEKYYLSYERAKNLKIKNTNGAVKQIGNIISTGNWDNPQRGRIYSSEGCSPSLNTVGGGGLEPKILTENVKTNLNSNYRIRKLTPRECFRLMGLSDIDIDKIMSVGLSDSSLYKLAGNSIVKQCLDAIHNNLFKETVIKK